jgi:hypothetical protein
MVGVAATLLLVMGDGRWNARPRRAVRGRRAGYCLVSVGAAATIAAPLVAPAGAAGPGASLVCLRDQYSTARGKRQNAARGSGLGGGGGDATGGAPRPTRRCPAGLAGAMSARQPGQLPILAALLPPTGRGS